MKAELLKAKFYIYIYIYIYIDIQLSDLEKKKEKSDHCRMMVEKKQHWNQKYQIQDPIMLHVHDLNIVNAETG